MPMECKRLPTPTGTDRDEREYLYSRCSTKGGVQRFKAGHHAASHARAAMIGSVQGRHIPAWSVQLDRWIEGLGGGAVEAWSDPDQHALVEHPPITTTPPFHAE